MRTLACLAAVILAGVPAAATPILIDDITATGLLPVEQLLTDANWTAVDPDGIGVQAMIDAGTTQAMTPSVWDAYRSNVTHEREPLDTSPVPDSRAIERAALSHVQPAALTLAGVCLALAFAGGREWRRRNWHRRHLRRRG